jgi:DNA-binding transcriptional LysR family regulator
MIDLVQHRIDLALRAGDLKDSSLVARHLADWESVLCAHRPISRVIRPYYQRSNSSING